MFCAICLMLGFRVTSEAIRADCAQSAVPTCKRPLLLQSRRLLAAADFSTVHLELEFKGMNHAQGHDLSVGEILATLRAGIRHDLPATTKQAIPRHVNAQNPKNDLLKIRNYIEKNFEFVGDKLSKKAREVYYDKQTKKSFYGTATSEEREELAEEGIDLLTVPWISKDN